MFKASIWLCVFTGLKLRFMVFLGPLFVALGCFVQVRVYFFEFQGFPSQRQHGLMTNTSLYFFTIYYPHLSLLSQWFKYSVMLHSLLWCTWLMFAHGTLGAGRCYQVVCNILRFVRVPKCNCWSPGDTHGAGAHILLG